MKTILLLCIALVVLAGVFVSCDRPEPAIVEPPGPTLAAVKINELYSRGDTLNPDWVELYNPNTEPVDIGGYKIYDSGGQSGSKPKKEIPAGTILSALGFLVITVDTADTSGFGLSSGGETVWLDNAAGAIADSVTFPALGIDTSYARVPDGFANWTTLTLPTKGVTNGGGGGAVLPIVINESYSRGIATDPDWVELYNPNAGPVTLTGYKIYDPGGNAGTKPKFELPAGTVIPALGYYVIVVDITDPWGFGLSSGGDEIWLENAGGTVIDYVAIPAMPLTTQSYGRYPDGSTNMQLLNTITKGSANQP